MQRRKLHKTQTMLTIMEHLSKERDGQDVCSRHSATNAPDQCYIKYNYFVGDRENDATVG